MPYTKKFMKLLSATVDFYGVAKGTRVAFATAKKRGWRY
jgi:hypothetical protein